MISMSGGFFVRSSLATTSPAPSSLRYSLPMPITRIGDDISSSPFGRPQGSLPHTTPLPPLRALDVQLQKVRGTGNAGVVVADRLLALPGELLLGQLHGLLNVAPQVMLDSFLVL